MKSFKHILAASAVVFSTCLCGLGTTSCADYLEVTPENSQVADDYWQTEQDVENFLFGGYYYLREMVQTDLIPWGELRAGLIYNSRSSGTRLQTWQMQATNTSLCDWSQLYKIINVANTVLERAGEAYLADDTYNESALKSHLSEAYFLRALSYFYLVRNWREVPLVTKAFTDDNVVINVPKASEDSILMQIKADLHAALGTGAAKESYATTWETKGRATKWAIYALLADVCLWSEDYQEAIEACDAVLNAKGAKAPAFLSTPTRSSYFSMFNPGNSNESIFELQWNYQEDQTNYLPYMFDDTDAAYNTLVSLTSSSKYQASYCVSQQACMDFVREYLAVVGDQGESDGAMTTAESPRTYHSAFYPGGSGGMSLGMLQGYCWKYVGSTTEDKKRTSTYYDPNFIIYRVADLILMKAEALLLVDGLEPTAEHKLEAVKCINRIRERAALTDNIAAGLSDADALDEMEIYGQEELLEAVLNERKMEFLGEGKIWYDFLRMGRSNGNRYKSTLLVGQVINYNQQASASWLLSVLTSDNALFLPIMSTEIESNPNLVQNPYYN